MRFTSATLAAAALALAGCAGTPPPGTQKVAHARCEHQTGSMLCSSPDEQPLGSLNDAAIQTSASGPGGAGPTPAGGAGISGP